MRGWKLLRERWAVGRGDLPGGELLPWRDEQSDGVSSWELLCCRSVWADGVLPGKLLWGWVVGAEAVCWRVVLSERVSGGGVWGGIGMSDGIDQRERMPWRVLLCRERFERDLVLGWVLLSSWVVGDD